MSSSDELSAKKDMAAGHAQEAAGAAQQRAGEVASHAGDAAHQVASTATSQAQGVKDETVRQAKNLAAEASSQLGTQTAEQTQRLSGSLHDIGDELGQMAAAGSGGPATELAHQAAERAHRMAGYLDGRAPGDLLEDLRSFARRRPAAFLAGAAVAGLLAGRLGRGVKDAGNDDGAGSTANPEADAAAPLAAELSPLEQLPAEGFTTSTMSFTDQDPVTGAWVHEPADRLDEARL